MGTFSASLKTLGDRRGLPATVSLEEDVLSITAGDQPIGSWSLTEITLEPTSDGYRMSAEGEQIILEMRDKEGFAEELSQRDARGGLSQRDARGGLRLRRKEKAPAKAKAKAGTERPHTAPTYQVPTSAAAPPATPEPRPSSPDPGSRPLRLAEARAPGPAAPAPAAPQRETPKPSLMERIDDLLGSAEKKWGSLMPSWLFTRVMVFVVAGSFLLMLIFPGLVSTFLLATGMLLVILGAVVYTDDVLASKWLPGRMTPTHVLIFGVAILMFGVLLGVITR